MASEQLGMVVQMLRSLRPDDERPLVQMRADLEAMAANAPPLDGVGCQAVHAGGVPCEWITAAGASPRAVVLYLHGGGYVEGSINTHRAHVARLSALCGARGLAVDYRLAPEHPFPAAVEDATAAYRW